MPIKRGVKERHVEHARQGRTVGRRDVLGGRRFLVAATVNDDPEIVKPHALALRALELVDPFRSGQVAGDPTLSVVVAKGDHGPDAGPRQACELRNGELTGRLVLPGAIIEIAGDHHEGSTFLDREIHDVGKGLPGRAAHQARERLVTPREAVQRTVEMNVRGVDEGEVAGH
jgi:hypothetical protein